MNRIAITGSSGLIGSALRHALAERGVAVLRIVRAQGAAAPSANETSIVWNPFGTGGHSQDPLSAFSDPGALEGLAAVIHLAGDNLAQGRWTAAKKRRITESRTLPTAALSRALAQLEQKPRVFVSASAIGIYGDRSAAGDESVTELTDPGTGFLADTVRAWEASADLARAAGIRVVHPRIGVVLSPAGGALKQMLPLFRMGLGGPLGTGRQWMSWVSLRDVVGAILFCIEHQVLAGAVNLVAPRPVTNAEFTRALAAALHRPAILPAPAFALRLAFGEMADSAILASARVLPEVLLAEDYRFLDPALQPALAAMLG